MKLRIQADNEIIANKYKQHTHYHIGDSGIDLFTNEEITIKAGETKLINFGIRCEALNNDYKPTSYWLISRSSIYKTNIRQANCIGLIDAKYRGNLMAAVDNIKSEDYTIPVNTRLFQIVSHSLDGIDIEVVSQLSKTDRGDSGFGSTGN
jgi:dUTP pyrophosphatase